MYTQLQCMHTHVRTHACTLTHNHSVSRDLSQCSSWCLVNRMCMVRSSTRVAVINKPSYACGTCLTVCKQCGFCTGTISLCISPSFSLFQHISATYLCTDRKIYHCTSVVVTVLLNEKCRHQ